MAKDEISPDVDSVPARAVTWRAILLGLIGVVLICSLAPYNAYVANNTDIIGNALPSGVLMFFFSFVLLINAPLHWLAPKRALGGGELAVALAMVLVSCTLPAAGLMRYLPGHLIAFFAHSSINHDYEQLMRELNLPDWLWPRFVSEDVLERGSEAVVRDFVTRAPSEGNSLWAHIQAIPFSLWFTPALTWSIFIAALYGAILCLMAIFREQWAANERLPFPLATVFVSLIDPPEPGRGLNRLFRSRIFWITFAIIFCIHGINAMSRYLPSYVPPMPLRFDLRGILSEPPFTYVDWQFKEQTITFTVIGLAYFIRGSVGFSLWFAFLMVEIAHMAYGSYGSDYSDGMQRDQMFGSLVALAIGILWIGRQHLLRVFRHMLGRRTAGESSGRFIPYWLAGWGWIGFMTIMVIWLMAAGASAVGAIVLVLLIMLAYLVLAKIVAETGLPYAQTWLTPNRTWLFMGTDLGVRTTLPSYFWSSFFAVVLMTDVRQSLPSYSLHAMRTIDITHNGKTPARRALLVMGCIVLALVVGYVVSGVSTLYIHYTYAVSLDRNGADVDQNGWGWYQLPQWDVLAPSAAYQPGKALAVEPHDRAAHMLAGLGITGLFSYLRLNFTGWPLHPVCFMLAHTWSIRMTWFSIFLGWLAKTLVVKYGGSKLFDSARDVFLALIIGEAIATAFWLIINLIRAASGQTFEPVTFIPA